MTAVQYGTRGDFQVLPCRRCRLEKPRAAFRDRPDGVANSWCNDCMHEVVARNRHQREPVPLKIVVTDTGVRAVLRKRVDGADRQAYLEALKHDPCAYCGEPGGQRDHIEPRAIAGGASGSGATVRKGPAEVLNLTGVCPSCNQRKGSDRLLPFLAAQTA